MLTSTCETWQSVFPVHFISGLYVGTRCRTKQNTFWRRQHVYCWVLLNHIFTTVLFLLSNALNIRHILYGDQVCNLVRQQDCWEVTQVTQNTTRPISVLLGERGGRYSPGLVVTKTGSWLLNYVWISMKHWGLTPLLSLMSRAKTNTFKQTTTNWTQPLFHPHFKCFLWAFSKMNMWSKFQSHGFVKHFIWHVRFRTAI